MVYDGNENYIFVSYAHADSEKVLPIIEALDSAGFRVWYDSGIVAGTEWPEYIEERLSNARVVLVFMTPAVVESRNCRNEINFALELKKETLVVYLEETTLLKGMRLQLNSTQSLFRKHHKSEESFIRELLNAKILQSCRVAPVVQPVPPQEQPVVPSAPARAGKKPLLMMLGAVLAALVILIGILAFGGKGDKPKGSDSTKPTTEATQSPTTPTTTVVEMSDNLLDFTVDLDGTIVQLPCKYQDLTAAGWTISSVGVSDNSMLGGQDFGSFDMSRNGKTICVTVFNPSGNRAPVKDCQLGGISWMLTDADSVKLAKGITAASTPEEIVAAFGVPASRNDASERTVLTYGTEFQSVRFSCYLEEGSKKYSEISLEHFVATEENKTETNTQKPTYLNAYKAPEQLGTDYNQPVVRIQGDLYRLPAPVSAFLDKGWNIVQQPGYVMSDNSDSIQVERNGVKLTLYIMNLADYQTTPENCAVYKCIGYGEEGADFEIPGSITFRSTKEQVEAVFAGNASYYQGTYNHSWTCSDYDREFSVTVYADIQTGLVNQINIDHKIWDYK